MNHLRTFLLLTLFALPAAAAQLPDYSGTYGCKGEDRP